MPNLRQMARIARRVENILAQFEAHGPLIYDSATGRWITLCDPYDAHGLAFNLLRIQRGTKLRQTDEERRVLYVRGGDGVEYLESHGQRFDLGLSEERLLEVILTILESERQT